MKTHHLLGYLLGCLALLLLFAAGCSSRLDRTGWHLDFSVDKAAFAAPGEKEDLP